MLLAVDDSLTGGAIVGGIVSAATGLYFIYDKVQTRRESAAKARVALRAAEIDVDAMANAKVAFAYDQFAAERRAAHERDVAYLFSQIEDNRRRLAALEKERDDCREDTRQLQTQNAHQAGQIEERAREIAELRGNIAALERKLKAAGALPPGTGTHKLPAIFDADATDEHSPQK